MFMFISRAHQGNSHYNIEKVTAQQLYLERTLDVFIGP